MRRYVAWAVAVVLVVAAAARACGPWFPNSYLAYGSEGQVVAMPEGDFFHELYRMTDLKERPPRQTVPPGKRWERTLAADVADLGAALRQAGTADEARQRLIGEYRALRTVMKQTSDGSQDDPVHGGPRPEEVAQFDLGPHARLLGELPAEFTLYVRGAAAFRAGDAAAALGHWQALLALPEGERRFRSTWATFMIGKALLDDAPERATPWLERTRELARGGFADSLRLGPASLGWQARAELAEGRRVEAMHHYFELFKTADEPERAIGYTSLCHVCRRAFGKAAPPPADLATDALCRRIVTAWVLSRWDPARDGAGWLAAVEAAEKVADERTAAGADRLAWAAYRMGEMDQAARWLAVADPKAPYARWVASKLLLRDGRIDEALAVLRSLTEAFPADDWWYTSDDYAGDTRPASLVRVEAGVLLLARRDYVAAADSLLRSGFWQDAAYVAERVLTLAELAAYVEAHKNDPQLTAVPEAAEAGAAPRPPIMEKLRYLLARRLARLGEWPRALPCYPAGVRPDAERYCMLLAEGKDRARPARGRAENLYRAAVLARTRGMEIMGTELDPDWACFRGNFEFGNTVEGRTANLAEALTRYFGLTVPQPALVAALMATADETARGRRTAAVPYKRFHYRYLAADLMWDCAELLPDDDPLLAHALWTGGVYLKDREPKLADRFYKALVRRCRRLPIGQEADKLRWFPKVPPPLPAGLAP